MLIHFGSKYILLNKNFEIVCGQKERKLDSSVLLGFNSFGQTEFKPI